MTVKLDLTIPAPLDLGGSLICLKPGLNDVDAAAWDQVKDSAVTKGYLAAGELVVVEEPDDKAARQAAKAAAKAAEAAAKAAAEEEARKAAEAEKQAATGGAK